MLIILFNYAVENKLNIVYLFTLIELWCHWIYEAFASEKSIIRCKKVKNFQFWQVENKYEHVNLIKISTLIMFCLMLMLILSRKATWFQSAKDINMHIEYIRNISSWFSSNSEASASELIENHEEMFLCYWWIAHISLMTIST